MSPPNVTLTCTCHHPTPAEESPRLCRSPNLGEHQQAPPRAAGLPTTEKGCSCAGPGVAQGTRARPTPCSPGDHAPRLQTPQPSPDRHRVGNRHHSPKPDDADWAAPGSGGRQGVRQEGTLQASASAARSAEPANGHGTILAFKNVFRFFRFLLDVVM